MNRSRFPAAAALIAAAGVGVPALAQTERTVERIVERATTLDRLRIDPGLSMTERSQIEVGGSLSFYALHLIDSEENAVRLFQPEASVYANAVLDGAHRFFGRVRFQYQDFSDGDSFDGRGDTWAEPFFERYWYEFDLAAGLAAKDGRLTDNNFNIQIGRQFVDWNAGLAFSDVLYAVRPTVTLGPISIEGLAGFTPPDRSFTDFDTSRDGYDSDTKRGLFGATVRGVTSGGVQFYTYILRMEDLNDGGDPVIDIGVPADFDYNATYLGLGTGGPISNRLRFDAELVFERGETLSDPLRGPQTEDTIDALAGRLKLTYIPDAYGLTRFELEALMATGDDDRLVTTDTVGGNLSGTSDTAFNSLGFVNTGLAYAPSLSNLLTVRAGASTFPFHRTDGFDRLQIGADLLVHHKFDGEAPLEEPTTSDSYIGTEADLSINYRMTSDMAFSLRYGIFFPGEALVADHIRHFVFAGVTLSF